MNPLPPPGTFAEGQRLVYGLLAAAAGMFCGACAIAMVALLMWRGWSAAEQLSISERTANDFEARLADARVRAGRLRQLATSATDSGGRRAAPVPGLSAAPGGPAQAAGQDRLPPADALLATEQAIQLDE